MAYVAINKTIEKHKNESVVWNLKLIKEIYNS